MYPVFQRKIYSSPTKTFPESLKRGVFPSAIIPSKKKSVLILAKPTSYTKFKILVYKMVQQGNSNTFEVLLLCDKIDLN